jgi:hypothetical protein
MSTSCFWYCMFFGQTAAVATRAAESKVWLSVDLHLVGLGYVFWFRWRFQTVLPNNAPTGIRFFPCLKNRWCFSPVSGIGESSAPDELDSCNLWKNRCTKNLGKLAKLRDFQDPTWFFWHPTSLLGQLANILGLDPIYIASFLQLSGISFSVVQYAMAINGRNRWVIKPPFSLVTVQVNA